MVSFLSEFYAPADSELKPEPVLLAHWCYESQNPLAAMCHYRNAHSTERLPVPQVSAAKEAPAGILAVAGFGHRTGAWK